MGRCVARNALCDGQSTRGRTRHFPGFYGTVGAVMYGRREKKDPSGDTLTMKQLIVTMLLVLSYAPAYAEWVEVSANKMAGVVAYADPDTIRRKGDLVKMSSLFDLKPRQTGMAKSYLSIKSQQAYDCAQDRSRALAYTKFAGNMGHGAEVYSVSVEQKWKPITPMSVGQELWKVACGER